MQIQKQQSIEQQYSNFLLEDKSELYKKIYQIFQKNFCILRENLDTSDTSGCLVYQELDNNNNYTLIKTILKQNEIYKDIFKPLKKDSKEEIIKIINDSVTRKLMNKDIFSHKISHVIENEIKFLKDIILRTTKDRDDLNNKFNLQQFDLYDIKISKGEAHNKGSTVCFLHYKNGNETKTIVYKPRSIKRESIIIDSEDSIFKSNGLPTLKMLVKDDKYGEYGYVEYVEHNPGTIEGNNEESIDNLFKTLSKMIHIFSSTNTSDMHNENIICCLRNEKLTFIPIDLEASHGDDCPVKCIFGSAFDDEESLTYFKNKFENRYAAKTHFNKKYKKQDVININEDHAKKISNALSRVVPVGSSELLYKKIIFNSHLFNEIQNSNFINKVYAEVKKWCFKEINLTFSTDEETFIKTHIELDFLLARESIPAFYYSGEKKQLYFHDRLLGSHSKSFIS